MRFSVLLTAAKEAGTIAKAIESVADARYSGADWAKGELILVIPDDHTLKTAKQFVNERFPKLQVQFIQDPYLGKPTAINMGLEKARGEIIVLTDGDVYLGPGALGQLLQAFKNDSELGGVSGRPVSADSRSSLWGYFGHLLADAAHHKRIATMRRDLGGKSLQLIGKGPGFFVLSGYVAAIRNLGLRIPADTLVDDAYLSYLLVNKGKKLSYVPEAQAYVKYPRNLRDWYLQKVRSVGGYMQLYKYNIVPGDKKVRNFWKELEYIWFPVRYARNPKELFWSFCLYPLRLFMWVKILWEQRLLKREYYRGWERVESTK